MTRLESIRQACGLRHTYSLNDLTWLLERIDEAIELAKHYGNHQNWNAWTDGKNGSGPIAHDFGAKAREFLDGLYEQKEKSA